VFALIESSQGWGGTLVVSCLIASVALIAAFVVIERRRQAPMLDLGLFRRPAFGGASAVAFALSASIFAMFLYLTLYLQNILGLSPLGAGLRLLTLSGAILITSFIAGRLTTVVPVRLLMGAGLALVGLSLLLMRGLTVTSEWTHLLAGFIVGGVGIGLVNPPLASTAIAVVPPRQAGMGSGINTTFRQVGIATGIAALGSIFTSEVRTHVASGLDAVHQGGAHALATAIANGQAAGARGRGRGGPRELRVGPRRDLPRRGNRRAGRRGGRADADSLERLRGPDRGPAGAIVGGSGGARAGLIADRGDRASGGRLDLAQPVRVGVVHEAANDIGVQQEVRSAHAQDRLTHIRVEIGERLDRERRCHAGGLLELGAETVVAERLHAAVGVVDQDHLARAEPSLRDRQRADHVIGDDAARVAQHVRLAVPEPQRFEHVQP
jgi:hypothetical protein